MSRSEPSDDGDDASHNEDKQALRPAFGHRLAVSILWRVPPDCHGLPAEEALAKKVRRLGIERARRVVRGGDMRVGGRPLVEGEVLEKGVEVELWRVSPDDPDVPFPAPRVIAREGELIVLDKPGDLAVHPSARYLHHTVTGWLRREGMRGNPCHRLDRETSGVLVCAVGAVESEWKTAFQKGLVEKEYLAVARGVVRTPFVVDARLALQGDRGLVRIKMIEDSAGQEARTEVEPVRVDEGWRRTLLRCRPRTGRQHQIRAHLAIAGFPLVGDKLYAMGDAWFDAFTRRALSDDERARLDHPRQALHAAKLTYGGRVFEAPLPEELDALVR
jgi:23S rRNA pseudouridine1911/1915/1917 synthase